MKSWHILNIVTRLLNHQSVCVKAYAKEYSRSIRSIQRDFESIKEFYADFLVKTGTDCYTMTNIEKLQQNLNSKDELKSLIDLYYMLQPSILQSLEPKKQNLVQKLYKKSSTYIEFKQFPYEILNNEPIIADIKKAITYRQYIDIHYNSDQSFEFSMLKPLKIVFAEGNWYLCVIDKNFSLNNGFRWLRINSIQQITLQKETFVSDVDALHFIHSAQNLFSGYKKEQYSVKIKVAATIARHFKTKKHLKSQKILQRVDDGSLIVEYQISNELELMPLVKKWIPHIVILSPKNLQKSYIKELREVLKKQKELFG